MRLATKLSGIELDDWTGTPVQSLISMPDSLVASRMRPPFTPRACPVSSV